KTTRLDCMARDTHGSGCAARLANLGADFEWIAAGDRACGIPQFVRTSIAAKQTAQCDRAGGAPGMARLSFDRNRADGATIGLESRRHRYLRSGRGNLRFQSSLLDHHRLRSVAVALLV